MITLIRIRGDVGLDQDIRNTLHHLRLRRKYACVVLNPTKEQQGMIKKLRSFIAFGEISQENLEKLIEARGKPVDKSKKLDSKKLASELKAGKSYADLNLKPFFRLHPPRKGINSKLHFPKGVLGDNKDKINELIERML